MKYTSLAQMKVGDKFYLKQYHDVRTIKKIAYEYRYSNITQIFATVFGNSDVKWYDDEIDWDATNRLYDKLAEQKKEPTSQVDNIRFKVINKESVRSPHSPTTYQFSVYHEGSELASNQTFIVTVPYDEGATREGVRKAMLDVYNSFLRYLRYNEEIRNTVNVGDVL